MPASEPAPASKKAQKTQRKRAKKAKSSDKHLRQFLSSVTVDGDTFSVGDDAYIRMTEDFDEDEFTEEEVCQMCGHTEPEEVPMIECDKCLLGYHITCLRPPLTHVSEVMFHTNTSLLLMSKLATKHRPHVRPLCAKHNCRITDDIECQQGLMPKTSNASGAI